MKQFILEFGKDFTFIGEEYRVQVVNTDFFIDLLFYNRSLSCLVPIELKIGKFKPEHIGQINFYLEALDRDVKKPNENPSVGVILCASKDDAVVEYALSRSMSPTLVADYRLCLPDKTLLQNKLRELTEAVTNCIVHAYPDKLGIITLRCRILKDNVLDIVIKDKGVGIPDVEQARRPSFTTGGAERSGMGFTIMESFMTSLEITSAEGRGTSVHMRRKLQRRQ